MTTHLSAWAAWLKHPWRILRRRHYLHILEDCYHEWRTVTMALRESRATDALHTWKHEVARLHFVQRAASSYLTVTQRFIALWLLREWKRLAALVRRVVAFAEARETRCWQEHWEEWVLATRRRRLLARWIFNGFVDYGNLSSVLPCTHALNASLSSDEKYVFLGVFLAVLGVQSSLVQCNESAHIVS